MPSVEGLKTADQVDAMGRLHRHRCHLLDLVSPTPGRVLFGPAVTISYFPSCSAGLDPERYNLANLFYDAVGDEPEGKVVVLASNGYTDASMGGGTKLSRLALSFKSEAAGRGVPMTVEVARELELHFQRSRFTEPADLVFPNPVTGRPQSAVRCTGG